MGVRRLSASAALVLLLVGCGGDPPKPKFSDSPSESVTSSESSSVSPSGSPSAMTEPTAPPEMAGKDEAAAEAFVKYYFENVLNHAVATGNTRPAKDLAAPICAACRGFAEAVDEVYKRGGQVAGGEFTLERLKLVRRGALKGGTELFDAQATVVVAPQDIRGTGSDRWDGHSPETRVHYEIQVSYDVRTDWLMLEWAEKK